MQDYNQQGRSGVHASANGESGCGRKYSMGTSPKNSLFKKDESPGGIMKNIKHQCLI